jgi:hypothetical protein
MKTLKQVHDYFEAIEIAGLEKFFYIDGAENLPQRVMHYFGNINPDGAPTLLLSVFEAPLQHINGSTFYGGFAIQLMVVEKVDLQASTTALIDSKSQLHQLILKLIAQMHIDREEQATGPYRWHFGIEQDRILPESNIANAGVYGWSVDINLALEVNQIMFVDPII